MSILYLMLVLVLIGCALAAVNVWIPMDPKIKKILNVVVVIFVVIWLLQVFGVFGVLNGGRVPSLRQ